MRSKLQVNNPCNYYRAASQGALNITIKGPDKGNAIKNTKVIRCKDLRRWKKMNMKWKKI
jgi:hypothetical protein